jgi:hypothetical protein
VSEQLARELDVAVRAGGVQRGETAVGARVRVGAGVEEQAGERNRADERGRAERRHARDRACRGDVEAGAAGDQDVRRLLLTRGRRRGGAP